MACYAANQRPSTSAKFPAHNLLAVLYVPPTRGKGKMWPSFLVPLTVVISGSRCQLI